MKIILDIPDGLYHKIAKTNEAITWEDNEIFLEQIEKHSTPLSKGHGRLIDADALKATAHPLATFVTIHNIDDAPTIVEADKEGEE